ncbi:MAG: hypothetical protein ILA26_08255 [Methanobrevibacter sp.]|uniref:cyclophilin-like fold protein n=1 Tax=Methanobrevibacter sp. TaxID=66852 RepID=UPI001B7881EF|nr:cyclophilin-like fold protein [Methanobrevibacter sp.]MBP3792008.1 hypothetical protein [Methanobrevibacter sp.]
MGFKKLIMTILLTFIVVLAVNAQDTDDNMMIKVKINDTIFDVQLENNSATQELIKTLEKGNVTINATDYGNFEKVGDLGFSLPTSDEQISTSSGDIVLYQGNQISLFYDSHSWSYTKLGKIQNADDLKTTLGSGDVVITFSIK